MARKAVDRRLLPSLESLHPGFKGFEAHENKSAAIVECLRQAVERVRQNRPVPFYSMRAVAEFFGVSFKTVADAYKKLEAGGLLTCVRGAHTLVEGRTAQPHYPVRAVVGLPIELPNFTYGTELRSFYIRLEEELRRHHHLANIIFIRGRRETPDPDLAERLLVHKCDIVFWWVPTTTALPTMFQLQDAGVRIVGITRWGETFPFPLYTHNCVRALRQAFVAWQNDGIDSFALWRDAGNGASYEVDLAHAVLRRLRADVSIETVEDVQVPDLVQRLVGRKSVGVVLSYHAWYDALCSQYSQAMEQLFRCCRVLLVQGALHHAAFRGKGIQADAFTLDHEQMAKHIATDIGTGAVWQKEQLATFYSQWEPRVDLGTIPWGI